MKRSSSLLLAAALAALAPLAPLRAAPAEIADPAAAGFDAERLTRLDRLIAGQIKNDQLGGAVLSIARRGQPVRLRPYGFQDKEAGAAMSADSIFRIASMSKAVTTVAVMMLYEEGRFMLHDPVAKYIPEFKDAVVAVAAPDAPGGFTTTKAKRPIQIRDLLSHTAGLTYGSGPAKSAWQEAGFQGWYFADRDETIGDAIKRLAKLPLQSQPGEIYQYGYSTDVLGYLVEVVSGQPLDRFFEERIFRPLKMSDTCFFLPPEKAGRLAVVYSLQNGVFGRGEQGHYVTGPRKCFSGGAGLLSTAGDYTRLLQMLLNEGELDGVRLLSPMSVRLMHENHTGTRFEGNGARAFGLGFWVLGEDDVGFHGELASPGSYGWGSAYFPQYLVDPKEGIVALLLCQLMPAQGNQLSQQFKVMMYQALVK
jgi:CubicO group peptidase (beta-lactamase class C family)